MIVLKLLRLDDWYGCGDAVDIAKGKNKLPESIKEGINQLKRQKWQTK